MNLVERQEAALKSGNPHDIVRFAKRNEGADLARLEAAVIASGEKAAMRAFLHVHGANVRALMAAIEKIEEAERKLEQEERIAAQIRREEAHARWEAQRLEAREKRELGHGLGQDDFGI